MIIDFKAVKKITNITISVRLLLLVIDRIIYIYTPDEYISFDNETLETPTSLSPDWTFVVFIITLIAHSLALFAIEKQYFSLLVIFATATMITWMHLVHVSIKYPAIDKFGPEGCSSLKFKGEEFNCFKISILADIVRGFFGMSSWVVLICAHLYSMEMPIDRHTMSGEIIYRIKSVANPPRVVKVI